MKFVETWLVLFTQQSQNCLSDKIEDSFTVAAFTSTICCYSNVCCVQVAYYVSVVARQTLMLNQLINCTNAIVTWTNCRNYARSTNIILFN